jgi:hypothetical protein
MPLSWNEIKDRALKFSKKWAEESSEDAEAKSFLDDFFDVFGVSRKRVASFEHKVKKLGDRDGFIDLLWKGTILIEMKSRGKSLTKAYQQAIDYFPGLKDHELPKYILVSDFATLVLYELETKQETTIEIADFYKHLKLFGFIAGYQTKTYTSEDPVNIKAADLMSSLHDRLVEVGYEGHELKVYLVRILFCLFAEDTGIFDKQQFQEFVEVKSSVDGSDLAAQLAHLFQVLNTPEGKRLKNLDEHLNSFRYINGRLFEEVLPMAAFDSQMRSTLLKCCSLDWSRISPAIFGSMFQNVMDATKRHSLGAHYTSETNILKLIKPLFLDNLWAEFEAVKTNKPKLDQFHKKLGTLKFLDPACGCGNFLVITYRELRLLEIEVIKALQKGQMVTNVTNLVRVDITQFYGIEYEEFPARIAEVALWLTDHQMNMKVSVDFGDYFARLPLKNESNIRNANALRTDWTSLVPKTELSYIIGNPPFLGHHLQSEEQKEDLRSSLSPIPQAGVMDYVSAWYMKSARYITDTNIKVGYVSTNSITQGEQVGILWDELINKEKVIIHFAHRTFKWNNEAKGKAAVYCVIIGFAKVDTQTKLLYDYVDIKGEPIEIKARNINPYLVDSNNTIIRNTSKPICNVPQMFKGSQPSDGGFFLLSEAEYLEAIEKDPNCKKFIRPFLGGYEFIRGINKYCIWLVDVNPNEIQESPFVMDRISSIKKFRSECKAESTRNYPYHTLFRQVLQPKSDYILVPRTTSENRAYIPFGFFKKEYIIGDTCNSIANATTFHFGILTSIMHMAWVKHTCGRLKSDFRYSKDIVYNNYPWPENPTDKQKEAVEKAAQQVLDIREKYQATGSSLADLYDPLTMPPDLVQAHQQLDKAVDLCYRSAPFTSESKRMEFLFELYEKYTAGLFAVEKPKRKKS